MDEKIKQNKNLGKQSWKKKIPHFHRWKEKILENAYPQKKCACFSLPYSECHFNTILTLTTNFSAWIKVLLCWCFLTDIDECATRQNNCTKDQTCINTYGGFQCVRVDCPKIPNATYVKTSPMWALSLITSYTSSLPIVTLRWQY